MSEIACVGPVIRCAIYTRKSTECPTGQEMNSLASQRAVCSAYIQCQAHKGWVELTQVYDDEGFSGGNLERPALHRLLTDAREGRVDVIVFYKIDRLTRSLADFVRLMDAFQHFDISFVSVTQSFDTSDSMGRMVLNILLTFAQFEREMMGDRIRDKKATQKRSGLYIGNKPPLGYSLEKGRLTVDEDEAALVREAFARLQDYPSMRSLLVALESEGKGKLVNKDRTTRSQLYLADGSSAYRMFYNPIYPGYQRIDGVLVRGTHEALISLELWEEVQSLLASRPKKSNKPDLNVHLLAGLVFDEVDRKLAPRLFTQGRWGQRYYETDTRRLRKGVRSDKVRVRGTDLEQLVQAVLGAFLASSEQLRSAVMRAYGDRKLADAMQAKGPAASEQVMAAKEGSLRQMFEALISRVEVAKNEIRVWISLRGLDAFLSWSGVGLFRTVPSYAAAPGDLHLLRVDTDIVTTRLKYKLDYALEPGTRKNKRLIALLQKASEAERRLMADPIHDLDSHAAEWKLTPSKFSRLLRLTYLAPDIKAAILDGRQPSSLTERKLLYSPLPADWRQQRSLLGFPVPAADRLYVNAEARRGEPAAI